MKKNLSAFNGSDIEKMQHYDDIENWIANKSKPEDPVAIANRLFSTTRTLEPADCVIEKYNSYPESLGLPLWLALLNRDIGHFNSGGLDFSKSYLAEYYKKFIISCNTGIDYTGMHSQWQINLLTNYIPEKISEHPLIRETIKLHQNRLKEEFGLNEWISLNQRIETELDKLDYKTDKTYKSLRTAFLSIQEVIDLEDIYHTATSAAVEANAEMLLSNERNKIFTKNNVEKYVWKELSVDLLEMLKNWKP